MLIVNTLEVGLRVGISDDDRAVSGEAHLCSVASLTDQHVSEDSMSTPTQS